MGRCGKILFGTFRYSSELEFDGSVIEKTDRWRLMEGMAVSVILSKLSV